MQLPSVLSFAQLPCVQWSDVLSLCCACLLLRVTVQFHCRCGNSFGSAAAVATAGAVSGAHCDGSCAR